MQKLKVLMTAFEGAPFYKKGGLGDVMESLPKALEKVNIDVRVVIPYYDCIKDKYHFKKEGEFFITFGADEECLDIYSAFLPNTDVPFYFLANNKYLVSSNAGGKNKRIEQFAFFSLAVARFISYLTEHHKWKADIIHCNDWHTALIPPILIHKLHLNIPTLLTIHNLLYQGVGSVRILDLLNFKDEEAIELRRGVPANEMNVLGEGIIHATRVSTVSPTYAKEIVEVERTRDLIAPFLIKRQQENLGKDGKIIGILNGIDRDIWNPSKDEFIFHEYDVTDWEVGKRDNKQDLLRNYLLEDRPTFCFVGRLANQKGLNILIKALHRSNSLNINIIVLGSGDVKIKDKLLKFAENKEHAGWVRIEPIYSEELAHKIYAGSDFIIIPSRYEPCGLIQMIAMGYGTIPIASNTGGLKDSIVNGKNGFLFKKGRSLRLKKAIVHALNRFKEKDRYRKMVERAMRTNFSWDKSAILYKKLYEEMVEVK